MIIKLLGTNI